MALGASYAGVRSMAATAGGGFALMQEGVSLAGMTETPIVIAVAQRPGPATGLPTRTEQGDLNFVLHAGHGEFPRILFAPGSIVETIALARKTFDLADRFQIPVFLLTDQYFADSVQVVEEEEIPLEVIDREYPVFDETYKRYRLTEDGISPLTFPGLSDALVKLDSDEHDEEGKITEDPDLRKRMVEQAAGEDRSSEEGGRPADVLRRNGRRRRRPLLGVEPADREGGRGAAQRRRAFGLRPPLRAGLSADARDDRPLPPGGEEGGSAWRTTPRASLPDC